MREIIDNVICLAELREEEEEPQRASMISLAEAIAAIRPVIPLR